MTANNSNQMMLTQNNNSLMHVDPSAVAAAEAAKTRIQAAYQMAIFKPRDTMQARSKILENCKRPRFAEKVEYSKPVAGTRIVGPSIRFAEVALREWGNVLSESQVVYEDDNIRRVKIILTDLETNTSFTKEIQLTKTVERKNKKGREVVGERTNTYGDKVYIVVTTDDELHNKEAALISKAVRNEGLRIIPSDIIDEAIDTARETLKNRDSKDPQSAIKRIIDAFSNLNISPSDLAQYLGHDCTKIVPAELQELRGMYQALSSGEARWSDYVKKVEQKEQPQSSFLEQEQEDLNDNASKVQQKQTSSQPKTTTPNGNGKNLTVILSLNNCTVADAEKYLAVHHDIKDKNAIANLDRINPTLANMIRSNPKAFVNQVLDFVDNQ